MGRVSVIVGRSYPLRVIHQVEGEPRKHGHNYTLNVQLKGPIDEQSGLTVRRDWVDGIVHKTLIAPFDGKDINAFVPSGSGEEFCQHLYTEGLKSPLGQFLYAVELQETKKNKFVVTGNKSLKEF